MKCPWYTITLSGIWDELPRAEREEFHKHLATCDKCSEIYRDVSLMVGLLKEVPEPEPLSIFEIKNIIHRATEREKASPFRNLTSIRKPLLAMALTVLIVIGSVFALKNFLALTPKKEIAENIDFLEDMDIIEKLVKVVDNVPQDQSLRYRKSGVREDDRVYS